IRINGTPDRYRIGQTLPEVDATLVEVRWDVAVLQLPDGSRMELKFGENSPTSGALMSSRVTPTLSRSLSQAEQVEAALNDAQSQLSSNPASYLTRMGLSATGQGYEVTAGAPAQLRNQMGLRPGDRIISLNGQTLGQPQNDARLLEQIRQSRSAQIEIQRGEQTLTIQQSF
ncbi:MAG: PDZ domain-containing protein, partial [Pseudomonadota bacterium]|nr:PDZ domain-containing protein [Pseudomonadota bacterium]